VALFAEPRASLLEGDLPHSTPEALALIPHAMAVRYAVLATRVERNELHVIVAAPADASTIDRIQALTGMCVVADEAPRELIRNRIVVYYAGDEQNADSGNDPPAIRAVDRLHENAVRLKASDIHLEPTRSGGRVRLRVDGILREADTFSGDLFHPIVSRVKLLAAMDIAERRLPQDGRYMLERCGRTLDARVSSMPTISGEKLVIRLLDMQTEIPSLVSLGMTPWVLDRYRRVIHAAHGFIVVCGPTGSGKTTTLYASLAERNVDSEHLCTVEDPIEVQMAGVAQVQVNPRAGLTFASALRAFLRQDPNVIMLGEMRDAESAGVAMSAALSGQLVMTTMHASDAPRALERLVEFGLDRHTLAAGLSAVVSQRLVRRLCRHCCAAGCTRCAGVGYRGRVGIFELLPMTSAVRSAVAKGETTQDLSQIAARAGYEPMLTEGLDLVARGETSRAELERVLGPGDVR
jgi:type II secretory ATPase GspE/PulE/Tfp pilus assembly ATPase PilB-like protein